SRVTVRELVDAKSSDRDVTCRHLLPWRTRPPVRSEYHSPLSTQCYVTTEPGLFDNETASDIQIFVRALPPVCVFGYGRAQSARRAPDCGRPGGEDRFGKFGRVSAPRHKPGQLNHLPAADRSSPGDEC